MIWLSANGPGEYPDLDGDYLDRLGAVLGAAKLRELLSDGLLELADRLTQLRRLAAHERLDELAAVAHDMVGAAGHLGLSRLSLAATDVERAARRQDPALGERMEALEAAADPALAALRRRIDGTAPG